MNNNIKENIIEISKDYSKPFYIYDTESIRDKCRSFQKIDYANKLIAFATMANINNEFLNIIKGEGISVFVNSIPHLNKTINLGFKGDEIVFTASGMDEETMIEVQKNKCILNLDSVGQFNTWMRLFPDTRVGIRCNIGSLVRSRQTRAGYFLGKKSRLGLTIKEIKSLDLNKVKGLHLYLGTDITDIDYFKECYSKIIELAISIPNLEYLDFGGGFGVKTLSGKTFDFDQYNVLITDLMNKISKDLSKSIRLIIEPGRIIGGESAWFITRVTDVKERDDYRYIGLNASSVQFPRPLLYPNDSFHPILIIPENNEVEKIKSTLYGCSTYSKDFFAKDIDLPKVNEKDLIIFGNAGSYCSSMFTNFLGFEPAKEFFI